MKLNDLKDLEIEHVLRNAFAGSNVMQHVK